jgi:hypothetical protein
VLYVVYFNGKFCAEIIRGKANCLVWFAFKVVGIGLEVKFPLCIQVVKVKRYNNNST